MLPRGGRKGSAGCRPPESDESLAAFLQRRGSGGGDGLTPLITAHPPLSFFAADLERLHFTDGICVGSGRTDCSHLNAGRKDFCFLVTFRRSVRWSHLYCPVGRLAAIIMHPNKCLPELMAEKNSLDPSFVHAVRLLAEEIGKYEGDELKKDADTKKYLDIISNKNIKLSERVLIPVQQYPKFNFVGKLLGPRGNSMKRLQEETGVKMSILGKGSMRDKEKEEELRKSGETKYAHLCNDLHVLIEVFAPPGEAYSRMSHALEEIKKFLVPDYNDEIRQEQLRELSLLNGSDESSRGRSTQGRSLRTTTTTASTMGHGGASRRAATPRGTAAATHSKLPKTALTRDLQAPRARGAAANAGYRPPLLAVTHESYDDYGYEDGYDEEYEDETYEAYDENYSTQTKSISEYYEHGHGTSDESYNSYEEEWTSPRPILKAPALRLTRGGYRKHPYDTEKHHSVLSSKHRETLQGTKTTHSIWKIPFTHFHLHPKRKFLDGDRSRLRGKIQCET
ncbi:PREDICTED: KH domain-containing, RNA-binding, signal transduction-associated protein 2 isoform X1 [Poecilia mexicana]|uniref:KH domain-containing, RNA-binding, signal transduction-associated protein 2 isoform X1 n=1 Tax=Poecilia mexicana TaxID=48701 RepID=UPI00072DB2EE|nr:PREDICTED: KH domain-containing, RNA-binding, signal transduction-associated protein 2 isoform X1 [Poecilia mexicana]